MLYVFFKEIDNTSIRGTISIFVPFLNACWQVEVCLLPIQFISH